MPKHLDEPPDPRELPLRPEPGTIFQHCRTGPKREYSGPLDPRIVARIMGAGGKPGSWFVVDELGGTYMIFRKPDGTWLEYK